MNKVFAGVGVFIKNDVGQIVLCQRKAQHGLGCYSIPGGSMEAGETPEESVRREIKEETNLSLGNLHYLGVTNNLATFEKEGIHYVSFIFSCDDYDGELKLMEPEKHQSWDWYDIDDLPHPLFESTQLGLKLLGG